MKVTPAMVPQPESIINLLISPKDLKQHAKKVVSDRPMLVDFAIGPVNFVLNLHKLVFWEIQITEEL